MTDTAMAETTEMTEQQQSDDSNPSKDPEKAEKYGWIDFDQLPESARDQVRDRMDGLRDSLRQKQEQFDTLAEHSRVLETRLTQLESAQKQEKADVQLAEVRKGLAEAQAKGDYETAARYQEMLVDLKSPKPQPAKQQQESGLTAAQERALFKWQGEITDDGRVVRPWANPNHAKYKETIAQLTELSQDPAVAGRGFSAILQEVDRRMAPQPAHASPVSSGDTSPARQPRQSIQLTDGERYVATKLYPGKSREEAIKAYTEAKKKYGTGRP